MALFKLTLCFLSPCLLQVPGRKKQLGDGQSGHAGELSQVPSIWPGEGQAVLLQSALRQQVRCQWPLWAELANLPRKATRWDWMCYVPVTIYYSACCKGHLDFKRAPSLFDISAQNCVPPTPALHSYGNFTTEKIVEKILWIYLPPFSSLLEIAGR